MTVVDPPARDADRTRRAILSAATAEFAAHGFSGARVDAIASRAGANKRMLYHYFGNKEDLYLDVLEAAYGGIRRAESKLDLADLEPEEGMRQLVLFTWEYFLEHPEFISLLNTENLLEARHLKRSRRIHDLHQPLVATMAQLIARGEAAGRFRTGIDPTQLYISIASLGFFYLSNRHTLSTIFGRQLGGQKALSTRRQHIVDVILGYLRKEQD